MGASLQRIKQWYNKFIQRGTRLPLGIRYSLGTIMIIVGIISIPNPLIAGWALIAGGIAIITQQNHETIEATIIHRRHTIYDRMRTRWLRMMKKLPTTQTIKTTLGSFKHRLTSILY